MKSGVAEAQGGCGEAVGEEIEEPGSGQTRGSLYMELGRLDHSHC